MFELTGKIMVCLAMAVLFTIGTFPFWAPIALITHYARPLVRSHNKIMRQTTTAFLLIIGLATTLRFMYPAAAYTVKRTKVINSYVHKAFQPKSPRQ